MALWIKCFLVDSLANLLYILARKTFRPITNNISSQRKLVYQVFKCCISALGCLSSCCCPLRRVYFILCSEVFINLSFYDSCIIGIYHSIYSFDQVLLAFQFPKYFLADSFCESRSAFYLIIMWIEIEFKCYFFSLKKVVFFSFALS